MGTNFYARIPMKKRSKCIMLINDIKEKIENNKADKYDVQDFCYELQEEFKNNYIHLGKRSAGWAFCWDLNKMKFYEPTLESIKKFIKDNNAIIVDEYGEEFNWDEFINEELGNWLQPGKRIVTITNSLGKTEEVEREFWTHKTYACAHPEEYSWFTNNPKAHEWNLERWAKDGMVDYAYDELITKEGLRFVLYTDFS